MGVSFLFLIALCVFLSLAVPSLSYSVLRRGSSLSVENTVDVLISPNGVFSAGFYPIGDNAFCFGIWFSKPTCTINCTIVWMANRGFPVNGKRSKLLLQNSGNLILTDAAKSTAWSTRITSLHPTELRLNNKGNLVLKSTEDGVLWQSFDSPTDTLLPSQQITREKPLVSSRSGTDFSTGFYKLVFSDDNILRLLYDGPNGYSIYWPDPWLRSWDGGRSPYNSSTFASLDSFGLFSSSDNLTVYSADYGVRVQRRLTLDFDGNLRLYSRREDSMNWNVSWQAISELCHIHGACGPQSTCNHNSATGRTCSCLPGHRTKNLTDWSYGCEPEFTPSSRNDNNTTDFIRVKHVEFYGNDFGYFPNFTLQQCKEQCLSLWNCRGFQHRYRKKCKFPTCYLKSILLNGQHSPSFDADFFIRVPKTTKEMLQKDESYETMVSGMELDCSGGSRRPLERDYQKRPENGKVKLFLWFACAIGVIEIIGIISAWCFLMRSHKKTSEATQDCHPAVSGFKRFTYSELKMATRNFSQEIGRGAGGVVFKGKLTDNRVAAIKQLNTANHGEAEFLAEVSTIGRLNHMNVIEMWGYCAEGKHRLLVYEYMEHGSLAESLSSNGFDWRKRFDIALGTARGLAYLHDECLEWVLHCDVKPQNILLDSEFRPKVSDFGLSKLQKRGDHLNNSSFSRMRGTRGYMAPEWAFNMPITSKVDVYSYGIVLLELVTGKTPVMGVHAMQNRREMEQGRLMTWVREKKNEANANGSWIDEVVDPILEGEYDKCEVEILLKLALQCVEEDKDARPTMHTAVEMLKCHEK